jgi:N-acetylmuramoyl-L-alanine amidase
MSLKFRTRAKTDHIVIHCSATPAGRDIGVRDIRRWHIDQGFIDVGYHYVIRLDGRVEEGRPHHVVGAHATGVNERSVGICLIGGVSATDIKKAENTYTAQQYASLEELVKKLQGVYPAADVIGHRDVPGTRRECPCFDVRAWWKMVGGHAG